MGWYPRPSKNQTRTHSCSRSSDISRAKPREPCTRRGSRSFTTSSKRIHRKKQRSTKCLNQPVLLSASTSPALWLAELRRMKRGKSLSQIRFQSWNPSQCRLRQWRQRLIKRIRHDLLQSVQQVQMALNRKSRINCLGYMIYSSIGRVL